LPHLRRQYIGIALIAMIASTAFVYLRATRPSKEAPIRVTLLKFPDSLFGMREDSPSMTMSLVCQQPIGILDIRFISTMNSSNTIDQLGLRFDDPADLLQIPPLSNLSRLFSQYGARPRILNQTITLAGRELTMRTFDFDASSGGIILGGAYLVYDFLFNSSNHLVGFCKGMEDFFYRAEDTLEFIGIECNKNVTQYFSEAAAGRKTLRERPDGGLVRFTDLSPGDVISITIRWKPNTKASSQEAKNALLGDRFMERVEVMADGEMLDLGLQPTFIKNLG